jgi:hypothetical protein
MIMIMIHDDYHDDHDHDDENNDEQNSQHSFCQNMGLTTKETYQLPENYKTGKLKCLRRLLL